MHEAVADPDRHRRRPWLAVQHHVEVRIERGDFVDLRHRDAHQLGEAVQHPGRQTPLGILNQVQVLDQQRTLVGAAADERAGGLQLGRLQDPALGVEWRRTPARTGMHCPTTSAGVAPPLARLFAHPCPVLAQVISRVAR